MYNDEQNLYHYTYRKDGTEPGQRYDAKQPTVDEQLNSHRQQQEHGGKQRRLPERQAKEIQINAATPALLNLGRTTEAEQPGPK